MQRVREINRQTRGDKSSCLLKLPVIIRVHSFCSIFSPTQVFFTPMQSRFVHVGALMTDAEEVSLLLRVDVLSLTVDVQLVCTERSRLIWLRPLVKTPAGRFFRRYYISWLT